MWVGGGGGGWGLGWWWWWGGGVVGVVGAGATGSGKRKNNALLNVGQNSHSSVPDRCELLPYIKKMIPAK